MSLAIFSWPWVFGTGAFFLSLIFTLVICLDNRNPKNIRLFLGRLHNYSEMQVDRKESVEADAISEDRSWLCFRDNCCTNNLNHKPASFVLTRRQHLILLGILKKAEAKAAALASLYVFGLIAVITILVTEKNICPNSTIHLHSVGGILFSLIILAADGAGHLGQRDYQKLSRSTHANTFGRELQKQLIKDALKKESMLWAAWWLLLFAIILGILSYIIPAIPYYCAQP